MATKTLTKDQFTELAHNGNWRVVVDMCSYGMVDDNIRSEFGGNFNTTYTTAICDRISITHHSVISYETINVFQSRRNIAEYPTYITTELPLGDEAWEISGVRVIGEKNIPLTPSEIGELLPKKFSKALFTFPEDYHIDRYRCCENC